MSSIDGEAHEKWSNDHLVVQPRCSIASIMKTVYLLIFMATAFLLLWKLTKEPLQFIGRSPVAAFDIEYAAYIVFFSFLVLHFVRMYLTLEMLEDPQTSLHRTCVPVVIDRTTGFWVWAASIVVRFMEQLFRGILVALVGFKAVSLIGKIGINGPTIEQLAGISPASNPFHWIWTAFKFGVLNTEHSLGFVAYLLLVYCILLAWDLSVIIGGFLSGKTAAVWDEDKAFFVANVLGIGLTSTVLILAAQVGSDLRLILGVLVATYGFTFVSDLARNWREYEESIFSSIRNLLYPYYGQRCAGASSIGQICNLRDGGDACPEKVTMQHGAVFAFFILPSLAALGFLVGPDYLCVFVMSLVIFWAIISVIAIRR
jgi:hypothetical protein